ncbi:MAG: transcriptional regulator, GntR family [Devosia sp.]|nr:transcriptional regulator, GntR family [Devosia sp.]
MGNNDNEGAGAAKAALSPDSITNKLLDVISSGQYAPGQRISESELARQLGVSRGPVREALGRLEGRLVERRQNLGVRLIELGRERVKELFLVREALEGMAARLATESITNKELDELYHLLERHQEAIGNNAQAGYLQGVGDDDFHFAIVTASRYPTIRRVLMDEIYFQLRLHRRRSGTQPGRAAAALLEHRAVVDAMAGRNPDRAEEAMRQHLRNARYSALGALDV